MTLEEEYKFLHLLEAGEFYEVDNTPTPEEAEAKVFRSHRSTYRTLANVASHMSTPTQRFVVRIGDPNDPAKAEKVLVYCTYKNGKTGDVPERRRGGPGSGGYKRAPRRGPQVPQPAAQAKREYTLGPGQRIVTESDAQKLALIMVSHIREQKAVQEFRDNKWVDVTHPNWSLPVACLRIKPEPLLKLYVVHSRADKKHIVKAAYSIEELGDHDPACRLTFTEDDDTEE